MPSLKPDATYASCHDGQFVSLHLTCTECGHIKHLAVAIAADLAEIYGWGDRIADLTPHLRCRNCGARDPIARRCRGF